MILLRYTHTFLRFLKSNWTMDISHTQTVTGTRKASGFAAEIFSFKLHGRVRNRSLCRKTKFCFPDCDFRLHAAIWLCFLLLFSFCDRIFLQVVFPIQLLSILCLVFCLVNENPLNCARAVHFCFLRVVGALADFFFN